MRVAGYCSKVGLVGQRNTATTAQRLRLVALAAGVALASCGGRETVNVTVPDAATPDATARDAKASEASARDATAPKASVRDASTRDVSLRDASMRDASVRDAAARDASPTIDGSAGTTLSSAAQLASWDAALDAARCDAEERCAVEVGPLYASRADCARSAENEWYSRFFANVSHYEPLAKVFTLGSEAVRKACLDTLRNQPCSESRWQPAECDAALVPLNPLSENAVCSTANGWTPNAPCAVGFKCDTSKSSCGVCAPSTVLPVGARCSTDLDCQTAFCDPTLHTCRPSSERRAEGMPCLQTECLPRLTCVGPFGKGVCTRYLKEGEPCGLDNTFPPTQASCVLGLTCVGADANTQGHCKNLWLPDGAPCQRVNPQPETVYPSCRAFCIFPSADAEQGTCSSSWPEQGDFPCMSFIIGDGTDCPDSHYPDAVLGDGSSATSCVCHPRKPDESPCDTNAECASRRCAGSGSAKTCTTPANPLGRCATDSDCTSGYCNPFSSWCDNPAYLCPPRARHDGG